MQTAGLEEWGAAPGERVLVWLLPPGLWEADAGRGSGGEWKRHAAPRSVCNVGLLVNPCCLFAGDTGKPGLVSPVLCTTTDQ